MYGYGAGEPQGCVSNCLQGCLLPALVILMSVLGCWGMFWMVNLIAEW